MDSEAEEDEPAKKVEKDLRGAETTVLSLVSQREAALADFKVTIGLLNYICNQG